MGLVQQAYPLPSGACRRRTVIDTPVRDGRHINNDSPFLELKDVLGTCAALNLEPYIVLEIVIFLCARRLGSFNKDIGKCLCINQVLLTNQILRRSLLAGVCADTRLKSAKSFSF